MNSTEKALIHGLELLAIKNDLKERFKSFHEAEKLWSDLGDIPVNEDGEIEEQFLHFEPGTDRETIWLWFEDKFNLSVTNLMFPTSHEKN